MECGETCKTEQVELQENGIIRDEKGLIIGRLLSNDAGDPTLKIAMDTLCMNIANDESYRVGWVANIAMAMQDEFSRVIEAESIILGDSDGAYTDKHDKTFIHRVSNEAAENFLDILCGPDHKIHRKSSKV